MLTKALIFTSKIFKIIANILFIFIIVGIVGAIVALILGIRPVIFSTGSMYPEIPKGALAFFKPISPENIQIGDKITVPRKSDNILITHRVTSIEQKEETWNMRMKGDANSSEDSEIYNVTDGANKVFWSINELGNYILYFQKNWILTTLIITIFLIICFLPGKKKPRRAKLKETS